MRENVATTILVGLTLVCALVYGVTLYIKDPWPAPAELDRRLFSGPRITPTDKQPFSLKREGRLYLIKPRAELTLPGLVVSEHRADSLLDVSHERWGDFINLKDLCLVWGDNLGGAYRKMDFSSGQFTCFFNGPPDSGFNPTHATNTHLLLGDAATAAAVVRARPGDQVIVKGLLADYYGDGRLIRQTSMVLGDSDCETVFVTNLELLHEAGAFARGLNRAAFWLGLAGLFATAVSFIRGLHRRPLYADDYFAQGEALAARGRLRQALAAFDRAQALDPDNAALLRGRATVFDALGRFAEAQADRRRAEWIAPTPKKKNDATDPDDA